jgi:hypothetical protein
MSINQSVHYSILHVLISLGDLDCWTAVLHKTRKMARTVVLRPLQSYAHLLEACTPPAGPNVQICPHAGVCKGERTVSALSGSLRAGTHKALNHEHTEVQNVALIMPRHCT